MSIHEIFEVTPATILAEAESLCKNDVFPEYVKILRPVVTATIVGMLGDGNHRMVKECRKSMSTIELFCILGNKQGGEFFDAKREALEKDLDRLVHLTSLSGFKEEIYALQVSIANTLLEMSQG